MSVRINRPSAFSFSARRALDKSLSITASIPTNLLFLFITGIPPPPQAITILPSSNKSLIESSSIMSVGLGEATVLR